MPDESPRRRVFVYRERNCVWKIPAASRAEAETFLAWLLGTPRLDARTRFLREEDSPSSP